MEEKEYESALTKVVMLQIPQTLSPKTITLEVRALNVQFGGAWKASADTAPILLSHLHLGFYSQNVYSLRGRAIQWQ